MARSIDVPGEFAAEADGTIGFKIGAYDTELPLVIDPVLSFSTYFGGSSYEFFGNMAVDPAGAVYLTGTTMSFDLPTGSAVQPYHSGGNDGDIRGPRDVFVAKIDPVSSELVFVTYLGGHSGDFGFDIELDASGNIYAVGETRSSDFPEVNANLIQTGSSARAFYAKLTPTGDTLLVSAPFGGSSIDSGEVVEIGADGSIYIGGWTGSSDFPAVTLPSHSINRGVGDVFLMRLAADLSDVEYSVILGGGEWDYVEDLIVDASGAAHIVGMTRSTDFPLENAYQNSYAGGDPQARGDAYVAKLSSAGDSLVFSTYLGGTEGEHGYGIALDGSGNAYVTGYTGSDDFPTVNAYQDSYAGAGDSFVAKLSSDGSDLLYSTYLGGNRTEYLESDIAVDGFGRIHVTGITASGFDFPTASPIQRTPTEAYLARFNAAGSDLEFSTFVGGDRGGHPRAVHVAWDGAMTIAGATSSFDFPTVGAVQSRCQDCLNGGDLFVTRIVDAATLPDLRISQFTTDAIAHVGGLSWSLVTVANSSSIGSAQVPVDLYISSLFPVTTADRHLAGGCSFYPSAGSQQSCGLTFGYPGDIGPGTYYLAAAVDVEDRAEEHDYAPNLTQADIGPIQIVEPDSAPIVVTGGRTTTFVHEFQFADPDGGTELSVVNVLINDFLDGRDACYLAYSLADNRIYLVDDNGSSSQSAVFNGSWELENSQCTVLGSLSSASVTSNTLTLRLNIRPKTDSFAGDKVVYAAARDVSGHNSGWRTVSTMRVGDAFAPFSGVRTDRIHPRKGTGESAQFHVSYFDSAGTPSFRAAQILVNSDLNGQAACYLGYDTLNNLLYLVDDDGSTLTGPIVPDSGVGRIENSQCVVHGEGAHASEANTAFSQSLHLSVQLEFKPGFEGPKVIYTGVQNAAANSGWQSMGHWTVPRR